MSSLLKVNLSADVYMVCLTHALSTEKEEVMGLLIGEIDETRTSQITAVIMLRRSDKKKDRVEISPEQLSDASSQAEISFQTFNKQFSVKASNKALRMAISLNQPMRVLGWYHSHPHITVWPSHVDVQTQAMYQMLDDGFIGVIFSVFSEDNATKHNQVQVTCFQSINQSPEGEMPQYMRVEVPLEVLPCSLMSPPCLEALSKLSRILCQEEYEAYSKPLINDLDALTRLHNNAVYTKALCQMAEVISGPLLQTLEGRLTAVEEKWIYLNNRKRQLLQLLKNPG